MGYIITPHPFFFMMLTKFFFFLSLFLTIVVSQQTPNITAYKPVADSIINELVNGSLSGMAWNRLANMTDTYGSRICGSESLENSIDWVIEQLKADGFQNVTKEKALVPHWV